MNNTILEKKKRVSDQVLYALIQLSSFLSIFTAEERKEYLDSKK